jgi:hypothetical protein
MLTVADDMKVIFDATQAHFVDQIAPYWETSSEAEQISYIMCAFRHFDPVSETEQLDEFTLYVEGSGQTGADLCGYEDLTVMPQT